MYIQLCKAKLTAYNKEQTNTLLRQKFTNPKNYCCKSERIRQQETRQQLKSVLKILFNAIYDTGIYPEQWSSGIIVPVYKKGTREDPSNYRGITATSAMSKLFIYMLNQRINDWSEESGILSQNHKPNLLKRKVTVLACLAERS